jgi:hypothetical protein
MFEYDETKELFWRVGDDVFRNKIDALSYAASSGHNIQFFLYENAFNTYDWTKEPEETWEEILRQRAQQLRDTYQYLRLWYSGGADSHTILLTFINNNIPLDEIIMMRHGPYDNFENETEIEINEVAIPFLKTIKNQIPNTKITLLDIGSKEYNEYSQGDFHDTGSFKFKPFSYRELAHLMPRELSLNIGGKTHCEIRGHDKPRVFIEDGKFYSGVYDGAFNINTVGDHYLETFYITDMMPKVHIKQSHMLKNHLKTHYNVETVKDLKVITDKHYSTKRHINECCRYPLWKSITVGKGSIPGAMAYKEEILLMDTKLHHYKIYDRYESMMRNEAESANSLKMWCNDSDLNKGFVGILSKKYCLGE